MSSGAPPPGCSVDPSAFSCGSRGAAGFSPPTGLSFGTSAAPACCSGCASAAREAPASDMSGWVIRRGSPAPARRVVASRASAQPARGDAGFIRGILGGWGACCVRAGMLTMQIGGTPSPAGKLAWGSCVRRAPPSDGTMGSIPSRGGGWGGAFPIVCWTHTTGNRLFVGASQTCAGSGSCAAVNEPWLSSRCRYDRGGRPQRPVLSLCRLRRRVTSGLHPAPAGQKPQAELSSSPLW